MTYSRLAQLVERATFNRTAVGSSPTSGKVTHVTNGISLIVTTILYSLHTWPSGLRRPTQVRISKDARVQIPSCAVGEVPEWLTGFPAKELSICSHEFESRLHLANKCLLRHKRNCDVSTPV